MEWLWNLSDFFVFCIVSFLWTRRCTTFNHRVLCFWYFPQIKKSRINLLRLCFYQRNLSMCAICTSPIIHVVCPKILHWYCLHFLLGRLKYPGEVKTKVMKSFCFFWGGGGKVGANRGNVYHGRCDSISKTVSECNSTQNRPSPTLNLKWPVMVLFANWNDMGMLSESTGLGIHLYKTWLIQGIC